jgi:hypothetical protein
MCAESHLFWVNTFAWTYNPKKAISHIPFVTYPFQDSFLDRLVTNVADGKDMFVEKSREMGVSWMVLSAFVWGWLYHGWELRVGSRKRDYVDKAGDMDSLFEKMRYLIQRLPAWMLPKGFDPSRGTKYNSMCKLNNPESSNSINGEATNPNFGRGGRCKAILYDEFAFWLCAEEAWKGGADTTSCRIAVSTVNGKGNKFSDLYHDLSLDIDRVTLHWRDHPLKTKEWYDEECKRRTPAEVAQELDISYESSVSGKVYAGFSQVRVGTTPEYDYNPMLPLFLWWDFGEGGEDPTAMVWAQLDPKDGTVRIVDCYSKAGLDINYFGAMESGIADARFQFDSEAIWLMERHKNWKRPVHVGDPYDGDKTMLTTTIKKELAKHNIILNLNRGSGRVMERIRIVTLWLPLMRVHARCKDFVDAINNSRWPSRNRQSDNTFGAKRPVHNKFSNYRTALEYGIEFLSGYKTATNRNRFYQGNTGRKGQSGMAGVGYHDAYAGVLRR